LALSGSKNRLRGFGQSFGKQAVSFGEVRFSWSALFLAKSGFFNQLQGFQSRFR
jgi:hypothetical protein